MGGYVDCVIGMKFEEEDFFEIYTEEVVSRWEGEGEAPKFHPDTGAKLRENLKRRRLKEPFQHLEESLNDQVTKWWDWKDTTVRIGEDDFDELSEAFGLSIYRTGTPSSYSDPIMGVMVYGSGDTSTQGPDRSAVSLPHVVETVEKVKVQLQELGIKDPKVELHFMCGWWD